MAATNTLSSGKNTRNVPHSYRRGREAYGDSAASTVTHDPDDQSDRSGAVPGHTYMAKSWRGTW